MTADDDILETRISMYRAALAQQLAALAGQDDERHTAIAYAAFEALLDLGGGAHWSRFLVDALSEVVGRDD